MKEVKIIQLDKQEIDTYHTWGVFDTMEHIEDGDRISIYDHETGGVILIDVITVIKETEEYFFLIIED